MQFGDGIKAPRKLNSDDLDWISYQREQYKLHREYTHQKQQLEMTMLDRKDIWTDDLRTGDKYECHQPDVLKKDLKNKRDQNIYANVNDLDQAMSPVLKTEQNGAYVKMMGYNKTEGACKDLPVNQAPPLKGILKDTSKYLPAVHGGFVGSQNCSHYATLPRKYCRSRGNLNGGVDGFPLRAKPRDGKENQQRLVDSLMLSSPHRDRDLVKANQSSPDNRHPAKSSSRRRSYHVPERQLEVFPDKQHRGDCFFKEVSGLRHADFVEEPLSSGGQPSSQLSHGNDKEHMMFRRGCLKLSVYCNFGMLTVHVLEGRSLQSKWADKPNAYIRLSLVPDETQRTKCKTQTQPCTETPIFDEKFSFELLPEDIGKRLLMSVWHKDLNKSASEFLGCMSFGIKNIYTQERLVHGWYHLLVEEIGRRKHLPVVLTAKSSSCSRSSGSSSNRSSHPVDNSLESTPPTRRKPAPASARWNPATRKELEAEDVEESSTEVWDQFEQSPDAVRVLVRRVGLKDSLGMRLTSSTRPVSVSAVEAGLPADDAGIVAGDQLLKINGAVISHLEPIEIAEILQSCEGDIIMELIPFMRENYKVRPLGRV